MDAFLHSQIINAMNSRTHTHDISPRYKYNEATRMKTCNGFQRKQISSSSSRTRELYGIAILDVLVLKYCRLHDLVDPRNNTQARVNFHRPRKTAGGPWISTVGLALAEHDGTSQSMISWVRGI